MLADNTHLSERDLILMANGELPVRHKAVLAVHLESCWSCRERMSSLQGTIWEFVRARNGELDQQVTPTAGPRALLRARLNRTAIAPERFSLWRLAGGAAVFAGVVLAVLIAFQSTVN